MSNENSVNQDEIASKCKINLVDTDSEGDVAQKAETDGGFESLCLPSPPSILLQQHASASRSSVEQTADIYQGSRDPERIMRHLPADEFLKVLEQSTPEQLQTIIRSFENETRTKGGAKWLQKIFEAPKGKRSVFSTLLWWECRRPLYNLTVGLMGLPSLLILSVCGMGYGVIFAALFYAFFANLCYCLGAPAELVARACWREKAESYGPVLLSLGTIFSVILTVFLELLVCAIFILGAISPLF